MEPDSSPFITLASASHSFRIDPESIDRLTRAICSCLDLTSYEVSWDFVDAVTMRELNAQYRGKDRSTDVLSFAQEEWPQARTFRRPEWPLYEPPQPDQDDEDPPLLLGDVVICPEDALANAEQIGHGIDRETCFLLVHGILHLCGHDHIEPDEERLMIEQQRLIMNFLENVTEGPLWARCVRVEA